MSREFKPPFTFDITQILQRLGKLPVKVEGVKLSVPFLEVTVKVDRVERKVAREVVIRLADRRVLTAFECCDDRIENALKSLQEIRQVILDKQVELADQTDGALYALLDSIREAIRQFLTFEQRLSKRHSSETRDLYFAALEMCELTSIGLSCRSRKLPRSKFPGFRQACATTKTGS